MERLPSMWRPELLHVLCLHLPLVALMLASLAWILRFAVRSSHRKAFLTQFIKALLLIGVPAAWLALLTGEFAYDVVVRTICDPPVLQAHQWWSYAGTITYTVAAGAILAERFIPFGLRRLSGFLAGLLLLAGGAGLTYSGHLGASVVYQQGGGTYKPSPDCREFGH